MSLYILEYKNNIKSVNSFYTDIRFYIKFCFFLFEKFSLFKLHTPKHLMGNVTVSIPSAWTECLMELNTNVI